MGYPWSLHATHTQTSDALNWNSSWLLEDTDDSSNSGMAKPLLRQPLRQIWYPHQKWMTTLWWTKIYGVLIDLAYRLEQSFLYPLVSFMFVLSLLTIHPLYLNLHYHCKGIFETKFDFPCFDGDSSMDDLSRLGLRIGNFIWLHECSSRKSSFFVVHKLNGCAAA